MERMKVIGRLGAYLQASPIVTQSDFSSENQIFQTFVYFHEFCPQEKARVLE